jgi:hypothetical protein
LFHPHIWLHKHADGEFPTTYSIVIQTLSVEYRSRILFSKGQWANTGAQDGQNSVIIDGQFSVDISKAISRRGYLFIRAA